MSRIEDMAELTRLNKRLRAERDTALKRAEERYKDMMHANRHAERADQALKKEIWERHDDQTKATNLFCRYKETIHALQSGSTHMQQAGSSAEHVQTLQTDNARLQATLSEQKEQAADSRQGRKRRSVVSTPRLSRIRHKSGKRLLNTGRSQAKASTGNADVGVAKETNATADCTAYGPSDPAGECRHSCWLPNAPQQSPGWPKEAPNKRRRLDSMGSVYRNQDRRELANTRSNASIPTPVRQQSRANSTRSDASATTPKGKSLSGSREQRQLTQQQTTPNRQSTTCRQQKRPVQASPLQKPQQSQREPQSLPPHLQGIPQAEQFFSRFLQQLNAQRLAKGQTQLSAQEALPSFNEWVAHRVSQQATAQSMHNGTLQSMFQQTGSPGQMFNQGYSSGNNFHSSHLRADIPPSQQTLLPAKTLLTPLGQTAGASHMQHVHPTHGHHRYEQGKQQEDSFQDTQQSPAVSNQDRTSASFTSTTDRNATLPKAFSNNAVHIQATPTQAIVDIGELEAAQLAFQLRSAGMYTSPEDSEHMQDNDNGCSQAKLHEWDSFAPENEGVSFNTGGTQPAPSSINSQQSMQNSNFENFPAMTGGTMPSAPFTQAGQPVASHWNQQALGVQLQQQCESRDHAIDPALLFSGYVPACNVTNEHGTRQDQSASLQHSTPQAPPPSNPPSNPAPPPHPPTARKRPAPPASPRATPVPSTRSTPAPIGPVIAVCLHCHQNWWNESCDAGEPCFNCMGSHTACERPQCLSFAAGTCTTARCARVHEGDAYRNVVVKPKTLKRVGKKGEQKISPSVLAYQQGQFR
ncbi:hypothetical protein EJ07DRAFT_159849 [Lizonia empirigonia]|nr:hypothetical protein EJ07DRAFT_159849 [Lizonia empirigonia]